MKNILSFNSIVSCLTSTLGEEYLIIGFTDGTIRKLVYETGESEELIKLTNPITYLTLSNDEKIISSISNNKIYLWNF